MAEPDHTTSASPGQLYYAAIDGTDAQDSAAFGALLEERGWTNLLAGLPKAPPVVGEPVRLVDEEHPWLPIYKVPAKGREVPVICPGGLGGLGQDAFWRKLRHRGDDLHYYSRTRDDHYYGRNAASEYASALMGTFLLNPELRCSQNDENRTVYHLADPEKSFPSRSHAIASLLYVSSHGWLGGFMRGEEMPERLDAEPIRAQRTHYPSPYFLVGRAAAQGLGFRGPRWIVLAQCSTLNRATWPLWAAILARSSPQVRGILAYEEASPSAEQAVPIAERFFEKLKKLSFLKAWSGAQPGGVRWAAIVHRDAREDRLSDFPAFKPFADVSTSSKVGNYFGFPGEHSDDKGELILNRPDPFGLRLECISKDSIDEVTPENLDTVVGEFASGWTYRLTLTAPPGGRIRKAKLTLVHIRPSHQDQFPWSTIFYKVFSTPDVSLDGLRTKTLTATAASGAATVTIHVVSGDLRQSGLVPHHSYLWFRVSLTLSSGKTLKNDFTTKGLLY